MGDQTRIILDEEFFGHLAFAISGALAKSTEVDLRRCWCDGILEPHNETDQWKEQILLASEIHTKAWIDEGQTKGTKRGQFLYELKIRFGAQSAAKAILGDRLEGYIPDIGADTWIIFDRNKRKIEVQLF